MHHAIDDLAKVMARGATRRETLRLLGAGLAAGVLSTLGVGTRTAEAATCADPGSCRRGGFFPFGCQANAKCFCTKVGFRGSFCAQSAFICTDEFRCSRTSDCPTGWKCARTCCDLDVKFCNPPCGTIPTTSAASRAGSRGRSGGR